MSCTNKILHKWVQIESVLYFHCISNLEWLSRPNYINDDRVGRKMINFSFLFPYRYMWLSLMYFTSEVFHIHIPLSFCFPSPQLFHISPTILHLTHHDHTEYFISLIQDHSGFFSLHSYMHATKNLLVHNMPLPKLISNHAGVHLINSDRDIKMRRTLLLKEVFWENYLHFSV
jgi:hypothetical protein